MIDRLFPWEFVSRGLRACAFATLPFSAFSALAGAQEPTFVHDVRLEAGEEAPRHSLVLEDGVIVEILSADATAPPGARLVEGEGRLCLPAFVDAYATVGVAVPEPKKDQDRPVNSVSDVRIEMRQANRKGLQPTFKAATSLELEEPAEAWRKLGFALSVVSPSGELLAGDSCLVTTRDAAARDVVVDPEPWGHAAFRASGGGYPSTLMGYTSQLRQMFFDAERHTGLIDRQRAGREGDRPRWDPELDATGRYIGGAKRLVCEADTARDIERWLRIADEFKLSIAISGGLEAWRLADLLAERDIPVLLSLDWGDEVKDPDAKKKDESDKDEEAEEKDADAKDKEELTEEQGSSDKKGKKKEKKKGTLDDKWIYEEPIAVRRERRRLWEEKRDCALRLRDAGVSFAFGTGGQKPSELLGGLRDLVEAGLTREEALAALTTSPAKLLGRAGQFGRIAVGFEAHLCLWTDDPFTSKDAKAAWIVIEGHTVDLDLPDEDKDDDEKKDDDETATDEGN